MTEGTKQKYFPFYFAYYKLPAFKLTESNKGKSLTVTAFNSKAVVNVRII